MCQISFYYRRNSDPYFVHKRNFPYEGRTNIRSTDSVYFSLGWRTVFYAWSKYNQTRPRNVRPVKHDLTSWTLCCTPVSHSGGSTLQVRFLWVNHTITSRYNHCSFCLRLVVVRVGCWDEEGVVIGYTEWSKDSRRRRPKRRPRRRILSFLRPAFNRPYGVTGVVGRDLTLFTSPRWSSQYSPRWSSQSLWCFISGLVSFLSWILS